MALRCHDLNQSSLFRLQTRRRLSGLLGVDLGSLERLASCATNYAVFDVVKRGKTRSVEKPKQFLERVHQRLAKLLTRIRRPAYLQSMSKGSSHVTNARAHVGRIGLVKLDVCAFYQSIDRARVFRFFRETLKCSPDVAGLLARLTTFNGHLATGSCVSPVLAYFSVRPMFDEMAAMAVDRGLVFTCYVDDVTFSGPAATRGLLWDIKKIVHAHGLKYHKARTYKAGQKKVVTGILIDGPRLAVMPSRELDVWHQTQATFAVEDLERRVEALGSLIGSVAALGQVEDRFAARVHSLRQARARLRAIARRATRTAHAETTRARLVAARGASGRPTAAGRPGPGR